jgi:hypothetical protein
LADYLGSLDWHLFRPPVIMSSENNKIIEQPILIVEDWTKEISHLESFFNQKKLPDKQLEIAPGNIIIDIELFIKSHLETIKIFNGNIVFLPYLERLRKFKKMIQQN